MKNRISVLGSTGSVGKQTLEVAEACGLEVTVLTARSNVELLEAQVRKYRPKLAVMYEESAAQELRNRLCDLSVPVLSGMEGLMAAAAHPQTDTVVTAVVGMIGLQPTLAAIREGKRIALANKETLVCAGELVMREAERYGAEIVPVDSEHSALFQCIQGCRDHGEIKRLILTASGGPFFGWDREALSRVTLTDALKHPNWSMGAKITVDSATLMNKGLEFIEAMRLYRMPPEKISVVVHRQSIIHSLVEYCDNAILAQMGTADMRIPIQYALTYPRRTDGVGTALDLLNCPELTFAQPDMETFRCLKLALRAARGQGLSCAVLNGANEAAVGLFLEKQIGFTQIAELVETALDAIPDGPADALETVLEADRAARELVYRNHPRKEFL